MSTLLAAIAISACLQAPAQNTAPNAPQSAVTITSPSQVIVGQQCPQCVIADPRVPQTVLVPAPALVQSRVLRPYVRYGLFGRAYIYYR